MIKFDRSWDSILVTCTDCPYWHALQLDQVAAYRSAEGHQVRVHDVEPARAAEPRRLWEERHAASA
jgi:hypothetical protein